MSVEAKTVSTDMSSSGNVSMSDLSSKEQSRYDRAVQQVMSPNNDDRNFLEKLTDMWEEDRGIRETFFPDPVPEDQIRVENGNYASLTHGATLMCTCGSHPRKLQLPESHGLFATGHALAHERDCVVGEDQNIKMFGVCESNHHPSKNNTFLIGDIANTFSSEKILLQAVDENGNIIEGENVKGFPCIPCIVGNWENPYDRLRIASNESYEEGVDPGSRDSYSTITLGSFLICRYGGIIFPKDAGHEIREVNE